MGIKFVAFRIFDLCLACPECGYAVRIVRVFAAVFVFVFTGYTDGDIWTGIYFPAKVVIDVEFVGREDWNFKIIEAEFVDFLFSIVFPFVLKSLVGIVEPRLEIEALAELYVKSPNRSATFSTPPRKV